jgi:hypothetical protein
VLFRRLLRHRLQHTDPRFMAKSPLTGCRHAVEEAGASPARNVDADHPGTPWLPASRGGRYHHDSRSSPCYDECPIYIC